MNMCGRGDKDVFTIADALGEHISEGTTIFLLVPFNFISILVIFGFSDNLWDYGIIEDGYLLVTAAILSTPVIIHALFVYRCTKLKFKKF